MVHQHALCEARTLKLEDEISSFKAPGIPEKPEPSAPLASTPRPLGSTSRPPPRATLCPPMFHVAPPSDLRRTPLGSTSRPPRIYVAPPGINIRHKKRNRQMRSYLPRLPGALECIETHRIQHCNNSSKMRSHLSKLPAALECIKTHPVAHGNKC